MINSMFALNDDIIAGSDVVKKLMSAACLHAATEN